MSDHHSISSQSICPLNNGILILSNLHFYQDEAERKITFSVLKTYYQIREKHYIHRTLKGSKDMYINHIVITTGITKNKNFIWYELPVQVRCTIPDAWGWCTGTTQRDGMGREEGGGFRMGNTCIPVANSFWYLAKLIQLWKV